MKKWKVKLVPHGNDKLWGIFNPEGDLCWVCWRHLPGYAVELAIWYARGRYYPRPVVSHY